jgi:hypothetical protein
MMDYLHGNAQGTYLSPSLEDAEWPKPYVFCFGSIVTHTQTNWRTLSLVQEGEINSMILSNPLSGDLH